MPAPPSIRLGLIGAGRWGRQVVRTLEGLPGVRLVAIATRTPARAAALGTDVPVTTDWAALCRAPDVDGVVIATPPERHAEMLRACLDARKPALLEKPVATDLAGTLALADAVRASGVPVLVDHTLLFHPAFEALEATVDPAEVRLVHGEGRAFGPFRSEPVPVLWDRGPHDVAMALALVRRPVRAVSAMALWPDGAPAADVQMVTLRVEFDGGALAWIENGHLASEKRRRLSVFCDRRALVFDDLAAAPLMEFPTPWVFGEGRTLDGGVALPVEGELPLARAIRAFATGIAGGPSPRFGLELAVGIARVLDGAERSIARGGERILLGPTSAGAPPAVNGIAGSKAPNPLGVEARPC